MHAIELAMSPQRAIYIYIYIHVYIHHESSASMYTFWLGHAGQEYQCSRFTKLRTCILITLACRI